MGRTSATHCGTVAFSGHGLALAQARALQLDAMRAMNDAVEDGIAERGIADQFVPARHGDLAGDQQRAFLVAVLNDLQQVAPLLGTQRLRSPIVEDQQPGALQGGEQARQPALAAGGGELGKQPRRPAIDHREAFPAGFVVVSVKLV